MAFALLALVTLAYAGYNLFVKASGSHAPAEATTTILATLCLQAGAVVSALTFFAFLAAQGGHNFRLTSPAYGYAVAAGLCIGAAEVCYFYLFGGVGGIRPLPASLVIPAVVAGVGEIAIASPAVPDPDGRAAVSPLKLVAAEIAGVTTVYKVGGAQAIAALAFGTETIAPVDKIFGPGNRFVTAAKRRVFGHVGIDAIYGPTETVILADETADPALCAADLLAQAEHDPLAAPILITDSPALADAVADELIEQSADLPRRDVALAAFANRGGIARVESIDAGIQLADLYAPEHLAIVTADAEERSAQVRNAGGIFVGDASPEALGDYVAGPSHVMPTGGSARYASALNVLEFLKISTIVRASDDLLDKIAPAAEAIARAEHLDAHARSLERRRRDR